MSAHLSTSLIAGRALRGLADTSSHAPLRRRSALARLPGARDLWSSAIAVVRRGRGWRGLDVKCSEAAADSGPVPAAAVEVTSTGFQPADDGRWTRYQKWLVCMTAITIVFDG